MTLAFTIAGKPQPKQTVRVGPRGARIPKESRAYMQLVSRLALIAARQQRWTLTEEQVVMSLGIYFPDRRRRDATNVIKVLEDGITKSRAVWKDDCQCLPRVMVLDVDRENPRVEIELEVAS